MKTNESVWKSYQKPVKFERLTQNINCDVVVIGGGLVGITTAYMLAEEGRDVVLIESREVGAGATGYTTAMISYIIDNGISQLVKMYGSGRASLVWSAGADAIQNLEKIIAMEKIDCEFMRCNAYIYAADEKQTEILEEDFKKSKELQFAGEYHRHYELGLQHNGVWIVPNQAKFHPLKFLYQLAKVASNKGVKIFEHTKAINITESEKSVTIQTEQGVITAKQSIMATYKPFKNPIQTLFKKGNYKTYELAVNITKDRLKEGLYWDCSNPYYFFRIDSMQDNDRMLLGGADHRSEIKYDEGRGFTVLENYLQTVVPALKYEITNKWTGTILEPSDSLALIGEYRENQMVATAFSGNGMTYSLISAKLLTDISFHRPNPYTKVFDPKRIPSINQLFQTGKGYTQKLIHGAEELILKRPKLSH